MPHQRHRRLLSLLEKRLRLFPIVGILGARQVGKSTLLRDMLSKIRTIQYITLDRSENKVRAEQAPTLFIRELELKQTKTVCIDEIQKAPVLFDTLKAEVDEKKRPGRFAISGSTEFSKKTGVNDALTGRIALLRMYPLNIGEIKSTKNSYPLTHLEKVKNGSIELHEIKKYTQRGGMPGFFAVRDEGGRDALFDAWLETTCTRDLAQFNIPKFNPELGKRILSAVATLPIPNITEIAKEVGRLPRQIQAYLEAFKALFCLYEIEPYKTSTGKSLYYLFDCGLSGYLGSSEQRNFQIWFLNECFSQYSYAGLSLPNVFYYQTTKGSRIDFVIQKKSEVFAVHLLQEEAPTTYALRVVESFSKKHPLIQVFVLTPSLQAHTYQAKIKLIPWSWVV